MVHVLWFRHFWTFLNIFLFYVENYLTPLLILSPSKNRLLQKANMIYVEVRESIDHSFLGFTCFCISSAPPSHRIYFSVWFIAIWTFLVNVVVRVKTFRIWNQKKNTIGYSVSNYTKWNEFLIHLFYLGNYWNICVIFVNFVCFWIFVSAQIEAEWLDQEIASRYSLIIYSISIRNCWITFLLF